MHSCIGNKQCYTYFVSGAKWIGVLTITSTCGLTTPRVVMWITMLIGEYKHNLDPKKRLAIPSKFRKELGDGAVLTKGLDGCLFVFPLKNWAPFAEMLGGLSIGKQDTRSFARLFLSGAVDVEFDSLGRILIPDNLKKFANLNKEVVIAGLFNRLEVWDEEKWNKYKDNLEKNSDKTAEKLGELGLI